MFLLSNINENLLHVFIYVHHVVIIVIVVIFVILTLCDFPNVTQYMQLLLSCIQVNITYTLVAENMILAR